MIIPNETIDIFKLGYPVYYAQAGEPIKLHSKDEQELVDAGKAVYYGMD